MFKMLGFTILLSSINIVLNFLPQALFCTMFRYAFLARMKTLSIVQYCFLKPDLNALRMLYFLLYIFYNTMFRYALLLSQYSLN